jgi:ubiquinone/menaquinone biosynthesis C-methylase UbiE
MQPPDFAEGSAPAQPRDESRPIQPPSPRTALQTADEPQEEVPCPLCGADAPLLVMQARDRLFGRPGTYRVVRCQHCDMRYLSPRPRLDALGAHYPDDYFIYKTPDQAPAVMLPVLKLIRRQRWGSYLRRLERGRGRLAADAQLVDVGCGQNDWLNDLRALRGCQGIGVDFKPEMVAYVRDKLKLPIVQGTLHEARFENGRFDLVTMNEYLEHEPDPRGVLSEARRITKQGGHVAVEIPFIEGLPARLFGSRWSQVDAPRHLSYFTRATLGEMLKRCGYRLVHTETFQIPLIIGFSVLQACGATRMGRIGLLEGILAGLGALPFLLAYPLMDEFMFAVAEAE